MSKYDVEAMVGVSAALADPTRVRILALLRSGELSVRDIVAVLDQSQPRVSRHLKLLAEAGLIRRNAEGSFAYFRLVDTPFNAFLDRLLNEDDPVLTRDRAALFKVRRSRESEANAYFARVAPAWDRLRSRHVEVDEIERTILERLPARFESLLDLGTGTGRMLELLRDRFAHGLGVDVSPDMLRLARTRLEKAGIRHARVRQGDARGLAPDIHVPDRGFDVVTVHRVLVHSNEPERIVEEAARLLADGGRLLVVDFAAHDLEELARDQKHRRLGIGDAEIADWMRAGGLEPSEPYHLTSPRKDGLTVTFWGARKPAGAGSRSAANAERLFNED